MFKKHNYSDFINYIKSNSGAGMFYTEKDHNILKSSLLTQGLKDFDSEINEECLIELSQNFKEISKEIITIVDKNGFIFNLLHFVEKIVTNTLTFLWLIFMFLLMLLELILMKFVVKNDTYRSKLSFYVGLVRFPIATSWFMKLVSRKCQHKLNKIRKKVNMEYPIKDVYVLDFNMFIVDEVFHYKRFSKVNPKDVTFCSHKWYGGSPDTEEFSHLIFLSKMSSVRTRYIWIDQFCSMNDINHIISALRNLRHTKSSIFHGPSKEDYFNSFWCLTELILSNNVGLGKDITESMKNSKALHIYDPSDSFLLLISVLSLDFDYFKILQAHLLVYCLLLSLKYYGRRGDVRLSL